MGALVLLSPAGQSPSPRAGAAEPRLSSSSPLSSQVTLGQVLPVSLFLLQEEGVPATEAGWGLHGEHAVGQVQCLEEG